MHSSISEHLIANLCRRFELKVQVSGHYFVKCAIALLTLGSYCIVKRVMGGNQQYYIMSEGTKMFKLYFCLIMYVFALYTFDHSFDYLIVYICLFMLILFQIILKSHYV